MTRVKTPEEKAAAKAAREAKPSKAKISLIGLNDDPSLIANCSPSDIKRLHAEAELGEVSLAGNLRQVLNGLFNDLSLNED